MKRGYLCIICQLIFLGVLAQGKIAGVVKLEPGVQPGYTLFSPSMSKTTFLIDNCGRAVHTWQSKYFPGNTVYLLPDGNLMRTLRLQNDSIDAGGRGGGIELMNWESNVLWSYTYNNDTVRHHHDISVMPNGNVLLIAWESKTKALAVAAGRDPKRILKETIWPDHIVEVKPILPDSGEIVWEWHLWDHLIQDFDPDKDNHGIIAEHPELVDINYTPNGGIQDWNHINAIDYNVRLDQIMLSAHSFGEIWIIDHSTTTGEAITHHGGNSGKGGDLLYRWGNSKAYGRGSMEDQVFYQQHHTHWINDSLSQGGKVMLFNNGTGRDGPEYSSIDIIDTRVEVLGNYPLLGDTIFAPDALDWRYTATPKENLFSRFLAGAEMQTNGNILICSGLQGKFFEIDTSENVVWEYINPVTNDGIVGRDLTLEDGTVHGNSVFRCIKYPLTYSGFEGNRFNVAIPEPIEGQPWLVHASCETISGLPNLTDSGWDVYPNPVNDLLKIRDHRGSVFNATLFSLYGQLIYSSNGNGVLDIETSDLPNGVYILLVGDQIQRIVVRH